MRQRRRRDQKQCGDRQQEAIRCRHDRVLLLPAWTHRLSAARVVVRLGLKEPGRLLGRRWTEAKPEAAAGEHDDRDNDNDVKRSHQRGSIVWPPEVDGAVDVKN